MTIFCNVELILFNDHLNNIEVKFPRVYLASVEFLYSYNIEILFLSGVPDLIKITYLDSR